MIRQLAHVSVFLLCWGVTLHDRGFAEEVKLTRSGDAVEVVIGGKPFTTYHFDPQIAKSYLQPLRTANGLLVSRPYPEMTSVPPEHQHDPSIEPHQRPLYFAHGDINGYSFWTEASFSSYYPAGTPLKFGRMVFRKLEEMSSGPAKGTVRALFDLTGSDGKAFAQEDQTFTFRGDREDRGN